MNAEAHDDAELLKSDEADDRKRSKTMSRKEMARDLRRRRLQGLVEQLAATAEAGDPC